MAKRNFSEEEVAQHKFEDDCWVIVDGEVYDVTKFLHEHPGYQFAVSWVILMLGV
jgi:cytochrome b involved in lipid metabolism